MGIVLDMPAEQDSLENIFHRREDLKETVDAQAELLYRARALWIGGVLHPWGLLTNGQRDGYRQEIWDLVQKARGEQ